MLRGDVPHRGVENVVDHEHYRLYVYVDAAAIKKKDVINKDTTVPVEAQLKEQDPMCMTIYAQNGIERLF